MREIFSLILLLVSSMAYSQSLKLKLTNFNLAVHEVNHAQDIPVIVSNEGVGIVSRIGFWLKMDKDSIHYSMNLNEPIQSGVSKFVSFHVPAYDNAFSNRLSICVDSINNSVNQEETSAAISSGEIFVVTHKPLHRIFIEEFTGTWCPNCPRGTVALTRLKKLYGDSIVLAAVHCDDVMSCKGYSSVINTVESLPYSYVDRWIGADPYYGMGDAGFGMKDVVKYYYQVGAEASIDLNQAQWNEDSTKVMLNTHTTFYYPAENNRYAIGYLLVEDGMKGSGSDWYQSNNLTRNPEFLDDDFKKYYNGGSQIKNMTYNHVVIGGWKPGMGYDGCFPNPIETGKDQVVEKTLDISAISLIQDKKKIKAIALLIDRTMGRVVDAAESIISGSVVNSISRRNTESYKPTQTFTLNGRPASSDSHGLLIQRFGSKNIRKCIHK